MTTQLRIYTINRGKLDDFVQVWRDAIRPLRLKHDFEVSGAWTIRDTNQFAWLLSYDGPEAWETRDQAYYDSPERRAMDPDPAQWIARVEEYFVETAM